MLYYLRWFLSLFFVGRKFAISSAYYHRKRAGNFDDTANRDEWQKEVYEHAARLFKKHDLDNVLDIGCGSAYKLRKYFAGKPYTGVEVEPTLSWLRKQYPGERWLASEELKPGAYDLIICSDVIEHVPDPAEFLESLAMLNFKFLLLSTPDRGLIKNKYNYLGPPLNPAHYREWNFSEFHNFVSAYFSIEEHFISNQQQATQVVVCGK